MKKICIIDKCADCPNMDNEYYTYERECLLLGIVLESNICDIDTEIYKDCPLEDVE